MLALATGKARSSAGDPAGLVRRCASIHTSAEPQGISCTERAANYRNSCAPSIFCQRGTGHPLQACWKCIPLLQAGNTHSPALTHRSWRTELSLPQTCQALTMEPSILPCWLFLQELRKQVHKEALSKPPAFLLLAATREQQHYRYTYLCIVLSAGHWHQGWRVLLFCYMDRSQELVLSFLYILCLQRQAGISLTG